MFGIFFTKLIEEKKISVGKLSKLTDISTSHLYRIRNGQSEPSPHMLWKLSQSLGLNIEEYYKIFYNFNNIEEYELFVEGRALIEKGLDIEKIEKYLGNNYDKNHEVGKTVNLLYQLQHYMQALVYHIKYKNYKKSNEFAFKAIGVYEQLFDIKKISDKYLTTEISYATLQVIETNYYQLGDKEKSYAIIEEILYGIERIYFNKNIPTIYIPTIILRAYILLSNNKADMLFNNGEFEKSLEVCEKILSMMYSFNSMYLLSYLLELSFQNHYMLGDIEKAKKFYERATSCCITNCNDKRLEIIKQRAIEKYPKILD